MKILTHISVILLFILVGVMMTYMYNELRSPVFVAETKIKIETLFLKNSVVQKYNNFHMHKARLLNHVESLLSETVLQELIKETALAIPLTVQDLKKMIQIKLDSQTLEIQLKVFHHQPATAALIANSLPEVYKKNFLDSDAFIKSLVTIASPAKLPLERASPRVYFNLSVAFALSLIIGLVFSIFSQKSQQKIFSEQDVQNNFGLPVLGAIPKPR